MSNRTVILVAAMVLGGLSGCGTQTRHSAASVAGCAPSVAHIQESSNFTPFALQRGRGISRVDEVLVSPDRELKASPLFAPTLDGMPAVAAVLDEPESAVIYGREFPQGSGQAVAHGGLVLRMRPSVPHDDVVKGLSETVGERGVLVDVGPYAGIIAWADPSAGGVRPHWLTWQTPEAVITLIAVRAPEAMLAIARRMTCG